MPDSDYQSLCITCGIVLEIRYGYTVHCACGTSYEVHEDGYFVIRGRMPMLCCFEEAATK